MIKMKKISLLLCVALAFCLLAGCGSESGNETTTTEPKVETTEKKDTNSKATIKNDADVKVTIKKDSVVDAEDFIKGMKAFGADVENKEDADSFIFTFSASEYKKLLDTKHKECINNFKKFEENKAHYVDKIEYDDNFRKLTISVNKELYDASTKTDDYIIAASALAYQMYINEDNYTNVKIIYSGTEEVVSTFSLPVNYNIK